MTGVFLLLGVVGLIMLVMIMLLVLTIVLDRRVTSQWEQSRIIRPANRRDPNDR